MNKAPIIDRLLELNNKKVVSFHVPGHKNGNFYQKNFYKNFKEVLYKIDTTEIPGTDNLHNAKDIICKSQDKASKIFKSKNSFFLVNGSTCGIYSMIMAATCPGDKILIDRNCHQSVINATILGNLIPVYIYPNINENMGISMGISPDEIEKVLIKDKDIKAVVLTYPTYHGVCMNLKKVAEIVHKYDRILLIDEAHGAHLGLNKRLPVSALSCGADAVVQSTHKTLPSFTQSSMLHIQGNKIDIEKLKFMLRVHQSSSPSYLLLSSLDFALMIYETNGKDLMDNLINNVNKFRQKLGSISGVNIMDKEAINNKEVYDIDLTKIWFGLKGIEGYVLEEVLRNEFNIQVELSNEFGVLAISSIANDKDDFDKLLIAINAISKNLRSKNSNSIKFNSHKHIFSSDMVFTPKEALYKDKTKILFKDSSGYISGEYIIPYPPGIPLIIPGERINNYTIEYITKMIRDGKEVLGLKDTDCRFIEVLK